MDTDTTEAASTEGITAGAGKETLSDLHCIALFTTSVNLLYTLILIIVPVIITSSGEYYICLRTMGGVAHLG